jgi:copper(I)-binding protein
MNTKTLMLAAVLAASAGAAAAQEAKKEVKIGSIEVSRPWARATPKGATTAAGYLKLTNTGSAPDRLVGGSSDVCGRFEVHQMEMAGNVMQMRPVANGLEINPGQSVELKPGSFHVMCIGLKQQLQRGQKIKTTLTFEKAGSGEIEFSVEPIGSPGPASGSAEHMHMH